MKASRSRSGRTDGMLAERPHETATVVHALCIIDAVHGNWLLRCAPGKGPSSYEADPTYGHPEKAHLRQRDQASNPRTCTVEHQFSEEQQSMIQETGHATVH
ncbi:hypothetical protein OI25_8121 (plasmid) [Paraburkholderia fungorum]|jgi:hypothetical protein|uniref:Uncharacterized protein n=2 Tax=Paraburkholderia fungorum TaxID=134537 RepID=A0AAU8SY91_9BURK|nr:hypothetical protein OI25_8121 [Paraburkholderia fungorum]